MENKKSTDSEKSYYSLLLFFIFLNIAGIFLSLMGLDRETFYGSHSFWIGFLTVTGIPIGITFIILKNRVRVLLNAINLRFSKESSENNIEELQILETFTETEKDDGSMLKGIFLILAPLFLFVLLYLLSDTTQWIRGIEASNTGGHIVLIITIINLIFISSGVHILYTKYTKWWNLLKKKAGEEHKEREESKENEKQEEGGIKKGLLLFLFAFPLFILFSFVVNFFFPTPVTESSPVLVKIAAGSPFIVLLVIMYKGIASILKGLLMSRKKKKTSTTENS